MIRLFKPGERVQLKSGGPVMEVIKYNVESHPLLGNTVSTTRVECSWYSAEEGRKTKVFHQNMLQKAPSTVKESTGVMLK